MSSPQGNRQDQGVATGTIGFPHVDRPKASVVVVGWRSAPYLLECLRSLKSKIRSVPYEVIVSLNEPTPALIESLAREVEGVQVLSSSVNAGFGGACNRGAAKAQADFLVLLNDDAVVLDGWLETLVDAADQNDKVGAVGSRILLDDGTVQEAGAVIWADGAATHLADDKSSPDLRLRRVDYCSGASLLVRRNIWESVGGMDPRYFPAYYEDVDLCLKIQAKGLNILYQPRSTLVHRDGASTTLSYRTFLVQRNQQRLAARWAPALALHEPPELGSPEAAARAAKLAESRPLPLPSPLPVAEDLSEPPPPTDEYYLRKQLDVLGAYVSVLEEKMERGGFETHIAELQSELDRMHHAAADLQASESYLQSQLTHYQDERTHHEEQLAIARGRVDSAQEELRLLMSRRRYQMADRLYEITTSIPGSRRALKWIAGRHQSGGPPTPTE